MDTAHFLRFESVRSVRQTARGLVADLGGESLAVDVVRPDVVRMAISRGGRFDERPTEAVRADLPQLDVEFSVAIDEGAAHVSTAAMTVSVGLDPFRLDVVRADGTSVAVTATDDAGRFVPYATLNDEFVVRRAARPADAVYGLGEKAGGGNRRGRDFTLWNTDVLDENATREFVAARATGDPRADRFSAEFDPFYVSIPFFYHQDGNSGAMSASFLDNGYRTHYDFTQGDHFTIHASGGQYVEYLIAGPAMPDILEAYTWLTGRTAVPPMWALGYHQCRWFDYRQGDVLDLAREHRQRDIPLDVLWLDIDYMDGFRVFTWDETKFPDPAAMLADLENQGIRAVTIIDPGVKHDPGYAVYDSGIAGDLFCRTEGGDTYIGQVWPGDTAFPDFSLPETREWWGRLNAKHVESGLAGIWNDMNEPATGRIAPDRMLFQRGQVSHERLHNQYAMLMAMGTTEGLLAAHPERRTFVLSRAGFAGIQRYAANWMGDNASRWDHLGMSVTMGNGFGISGQAFVGADVGGFDGDSNPELFARWIQHGALTPFFRNHSIEHSADQYAWSFGEDVERIARHAVRLRYRLMPYLYSAFVIASETGAPVQRPLVFDFQSDPAVRGIDDQYLMGPHLLVAPVVEPGVVSRSVYLPHGEWFDWHTDLLVEGGRRLDVEAPPERIPLFVRAGAVIPMWPDVPASTAGHYPQRIDLHIFVPKDGETVLSLLQEDDGLTFAARDGACVRTEISVARTGSTVTVAAAASGNGFSEFSRATIRLVIHGAEPGAVTIDGAELPTAESSVEFPNA
ncbi:TIM-barrel domain-containing protein, partial [Demequina sp.]|uniref:glycoside hydrolase family 31 protein n=1 Tax=Demequina sp. TaxID=2050685 RepID=UPI0025F2F03E